MSDACGCSDDKPGTGESEEAEEAVGFWQVSEIRAAAVSGVLLLAAWIASLTGGPAVADASAGDRGAAGGRRGRSFPPPSGAWSRAGSASGR